MTSLPVPVFDDQGLVPVITQDADNGDVLMFAWMNAEALRMTLAEGRMVYWSRSRQEILRIVCCSIVRVMDLPASCQ